MLFGTFMCTCVCFLLADEQAQIQRIMDALKQEVDKRDGEIKNLQKNLKEAETILVCRCSRFHFHITPYLIMIQL
jgi:hypothetical protein